MDTDAAAPAAAEANGGPAAAAAAAPEMAPEMVDKLSKLRDILSGKTPIGLNLEFLYHNNKADLQVRWMWFTLAV
jgi:26S proteasome regulatory subunit N2